METRTLTRNNVMAIVHTDTDFGGKTTAILPAALARQIICHTKTNANVRIKEFTTRKIKDVHSAVLMMLNIRNQMGT
jgi:hypothetical protein